MILAGRPAGAALVLVIDQFEELFTRVTTAHQASLIDLLTHATDDPRLRVLATLRADFLPQCAAEPKLAALLQRATGIFPLGRPSPGAFTDIIRKPAERAGLDLEEGLVEEILMDAGIDPGALPLMAFCLEALYRRTAPEHHLTVAAYEALGRLRGAIRQQADALLADLRKTKGIALDTALPQLLRALVHVDAAGTATRRRAFRDELGTEPPMPQLVEALVQGRLLVVEDIGDRTIVTLAHEVLLAAWPDLCDWIDRNRAQMLRLQRWLLSLESSVATDRQYAAKALGKMGPVVPEVVPALIRALRDANERVRASVAAALGQIGPAAVPALIRALHDANERVHRGAAAALGQIGGAAVSALVTALAGHRPGRYRRKGTDARVRASVAEALGQIGPAAAEAVPALITALDDAGEWVRKSAAAALGQIGPAAAEAVPVLISALGDTDPWVRSNAAAALGQIGPAAAEAVPALITALSDAGEWVRKSAAAALGQIGPAAAKAVPALTGAIEDRDPNVARAVSAALEQIRSASSAASS